MGALIARMCCIARHGSSPSPSRSTGRPPDGDNGSATRRYKVVLLGATGAGKTEVGRHLSGQPRRAANDHGATNGVRYFRISGGDNAGGHELALTEVGGSVDMQRIWPHYYASAMAIVYCFDMSAGYASMAKDFALLQRTLSHFAVRRKAILLVATRAQSAACADVQLYDVENAFGLEALARRYGCALRLCYFDVEAATDVGSGVGWLAAQLVQQEAALRGRIKYDTNMQRWQRRLTELVSNSKLARVHSHRFRRHRKLWPLLTSATQRIERRRPRTAPSTIFAISGSASCSASSAAHCETASTAEIL